MWVRNEKGMTVIELLVSMSILSVVLMMAWGFFSDYEEKTHELAEYENARNMLVNEVEEYLVAYKENGDVESVERNIELKGIVYELEVEASEITDDIGLFSSNIGMVEVRGEVRWRSTSTEVVSYVSE